jgi:hypothetical protein
VARIGNQILTPTAFSALNERIDDPRRIAGVAILRQIGFARVRPSRRDRMEVEGNGAYLNQMENIQ